MPPLSPALRKAAVLISALDDRTADALLEQMDPRESAQVRSALVALDDIPASEQEAVLTEFMSRQGKPGSPASSSDVTLELNRAYERAAKVPLEAESPLAFLREVSPQALARILRTEQPQAVAVVVANLPPESAAELLEQLPPALASDALERLGWLDDLSPEVLADLARTLREQLGPYAVRPQASSESLSHQRAIRAVLQGRQRERAGATASSSGPINTIAQRYRLEPTSETALTEPRMDFGDLSHCDDHALREILSAADPHVVQLALAGADDRFVSRVLNALPGRYAAALRQQLDTPGPLRLREIDQAQRALAALASRLASAGAIELPRTPFAAAV